MLRCTVVTRTRPRQQPGGPGGLFMRRMRVLWLAGCGSAESPSDRTAGLDGITSDADCDAPVVRYYDADGDGHGDPAMPVGLCADVEGFVDNDDD